MSHSCVSTGRSLVIHNAERTGHSASAIAAKKILIISFKSCYKEIYPSYIIKVKLLLANLEVPKYDSTVISGVLYFKNFKNLFEYPTIFHIHSVCVWVILKNIPLKIYSGRVF